MKTQQKTRPDKKPPNPFESWSSPHPFYRVAALIGLVSGVAGWVLASTRPGIWIPVCAASAVLFGLLGVRSSYRAASLLGFIMGMFLLPNAATTVLRLIRG